jgi:mono/diheme cytochrome c family protein
MRNVAAVLIVFVASLAGLASASACKRSPPPAPEDPARAGADARALFASRCSTCHGLDGRGRGPLSPGLNPHPRDYTDREWQARTPDDEIRTAIVKGGIGVGKSALMPSNPDIADKPLEVQALVDIVRSFGTDHPFAADAAAP